MDRYAGDDAWREWFAICSVGGCAPANRERLRAEVESAMYAQLARFGLTRDDAGVDDPIAFFDGYFKLKGSREKGKPLKLYFAHRIRAEHLRMFDFVCGTLFGARAGRVHDIVTDWISSLKGWRSRIVRGEDGCRRLRWERTEGDGAPVELPIESDPAAEIDVEAIRGETAALLERVARKIGVEKRKTALLLYVKTLEWLKRTQRPDGSWGEKPLKDTALAVLALMAHGETSDSAAYGKALVEGVRFLAEAKLDGLGRGEVQIVACALCGASATVRNPNVRTAAERALASIGDNRSVEAGRDWRGLLVDLATPVAPSTSRATNVAAGTSEKDEVADACVLVLRLLD